MTTRHAGSAVAAMFVLAAMGSTMPAMAQSIVGLGIGADNFNIVHAISDDGNTAVGQTTSGVDPSLGWRAFRWTRAGGVALLPPVTDGYHSSANGISADGAVIVGSEYYNVAARWTSAGASDLLWPVGCAADGVSADGLVIVGYSNGNAVRWTAAGGLTIMATDNPFGYVNGAAGVAASSDGAVVAGIYHITSGDGSSTRAFRWTVGVLQNLGVLPGSTYGSLASGMSRDGNVVVGLCSFYPRPGANYGAFRWTTNDGMVDLGVLPGTSNSVATGVNGDGSVVVGCGASWMWSAPGASDSGWVWTQQQQGMVDISA